MALKHEYDHVRWPGPTLLDVSFPLHPLRQPREPLLQFGWPEYCHKGLVKIILSTYLLVRPASSVSMASATGLTPPFSGWQRVTAALAELRRMTWWKHHLFRRHDGACGVDSMSPEPVGG